ncbi:Putative binding domain-containing protein, N-terminal [Sphingobacterium nematocida]|uniref:Putative binding domain-containing protein, N-terminal n=1 Tax=Sphingobacterium nematocida TaxID=1513896 RepID=A0A1T5CZJ8_9SPHI|nr:BACON domain-containing protein [Sphingobacterium nematocida]SKB64640.1 Putative binding domain-containing protein, N-terminal [Sphingobacterium nematocida]
MNIRIFIPLLSFFAALLFHACKPTLEMVDIFEVSTERISLNYEGFLASGERAAIELASNDSWRVKSKPDWVELNKAAGERGRYMIFVTVGEAGTQEDREGEILFESLGRTISVGIRQVKKIEELSVSPAEVAVNIRGLLENGEAAMLDITTNSDWQIVELLEWIKVDKVAGKAGTVSVVLTVEKNNSGKERKGTFTVQSGSNTEIVTVAQDLSYSPLTEVKEITADQNGTISSGSATFEINAVQPWTATSDSWIHLSPNSGGIGKTQVTVRIDPTVIARNGSIKIIDTDELSTIVVVKQEIKIPDDGKSIGYVYLMDDFNWVKPYGGEDELLKAPTKTGDGKGFSGATANMHTKGSTGAATVSAAQAFADRNYEDINWDGNAFYFGAHYLKMGRTNVQTGLKLKSIPNIAADKSTNMKLTFNASPARGSTSGSAFDDVVLMVQIEGPGSVDINDKAMKVKDNIDIQIPDNAATDWYWIERSVVLYGVTAETKVTIKPSASTPGGQFNRWLLSDIKFEKHSKVN